MTTISFSYPHETEENHIKKNPTCPRKTIKGMNLYDFSHAKGMLADEFIVKVDDVREFANNILHDGAVEEIESQSIPLVKGWPAFKFSDYKKIQETTLELMKNTRIVLESLFDYESDSSLSESKTTP